MSQPRRRVAVTGLGVCVSNGRNLPEFRDSLIKGRSGAKTIEDFDTTEYRNSRAGVISDADIGGPDADFTDDRANKIGLLSAHEAVADSGIEIGDELRFRSAVAVSSSLGGMLDHELAMRRYLPSGEDREELYEGVIRVPPSRVAEAICQAFDIRGGNATVVTACSAGSNSIAVGMDLIRRDRADVIVANGTEPFSMLALSGFNILMALSPTICRPFDRHRDGLMVGEGAGTLILEEYEHAKRRGAKIYAELVGYGLSNDAHHPTQPDPRASGACRAIQRSLRDAGLEPEDVDYINAHGTATRHNDLMELKAVSTVYRERAREIPISSIKSMIGHTLGAAGTIEAVATILALHHQFLPPTINFETPEEGYEGFDFVPESRSVESLNVACSHSFGFGGNAACLLIQRPEAATSEPVDL